MLVLDEPTNDLDLETLDVLEEMLGDYAGTVLLISHDRDFLDRVVNAVLVPEGDGRWVEYAGGYSDMLAQRGADLLRATPVRAVAVKENPPPREQKSRRRLSFHEKHALESLPQRIDALGETIRALHTRLDDPNLYASDRKAFAEASRLLAAAHSDLAAAEEKWLDLQILREEIEAG